ncbi:YdcF family protein [Brachybacterium sp. NBEC-018]|uniref:YdcF family protein n=1 Tax=Brachybacterium sp. NBEC-018 TaxID=2996004 RepID=UPI002175061F|nr:YdcF family protein [Brachybacterium sp. NBEC-018]UVY85063.1 YdcF family protein [Brachybacterium sp. NBEC-018]
MVSAILAVGCWFWFRRVWEREPRRLLAAVLALLAGFFGLSAAVEVVTYLIPGAGLAVLLVAVLLPLSVFVLAGMLVRNGLRMRRREGRSLGNSLSLLVGAALFVLPPAAPLLMITLNPVAWGLALLILWGSAQLGVQFLVFYTFSALYERRPPRPDPDAVVVLGSGLIRGKVPPLLRSRLDRGRQAAEQIAARSVPVLITSGGQGPDEPRSEGDAMREYLLGDAGYTSGEVLAETVSRSTEQNLRFSRRLADEHLAGEQEGARGRQLLVVTNGYHVPRAALLSRAVGVDADVVGAPTARYFVPSAYIREFIAVLRMHVVLNAVLAGTGLALAVLGALVIGSLGSA